jgi:hypothetical protein
LSGAFGSLEDAFRKAGELEEAARLAQAREPSAKRSPGRWLGRRWLGPAVGALAGFCVVGGGVAISTDVFLADGGTTGSDPGQPAETRHAPGDAYRGNAVAVDPRRPAALWGVGVYPSDNGRDTCVLAGRVRGESLGVEYSGRFTTISKDAPGTCGDMDVKHALFMTNSHFRLAGDRALLYGLVDRTVKTLRLGLPGALKELEVATDGTFIVVVNGSHGFRGQQFEITGETGVERYMLQPARP